MTLSHHSHSLAGTGFSAPVTDVALLPYEELPLKVMTVNPFPVYSSGTCLEMLAPLPVIHPVYG